MRIQTLLEMPSMIPHQELSSKWMSSIDTTKILWEAPLEGQRSDLRMVCHPIKGSDKRGILACEGPDSKSAVAAMMISEMRSGANTFSEVFAVTVAPKARGQNIAQDMYVTLAMVRNYIVVSDDTQTAGGAAIWKHLAKDYPGHVAATDGDHLIPLNDWKNGDPFTDPDSRLLFYNIPPKDIPSL